ncbi:UDP-N-acetylmuramoyl-L-alanine--D-glutamate ligase [Weissella muntiaci]|uniref:UDP-N-acetylmuramoylalanine--D-glutamate ligase n=1 Tax=Weissella muntiaci TaxID=2508881 RepID=A0A6C2C7W9_9LACO|nr:UDP-N-acetylmuramoyl-L-alanine--D-glutamate ligase [Weissella muntiaci]TYC50130.1 UDP-N-acetylmuramoyl-L-alanine--D-glutamate ligase [Weissella muntiaci]
MTKRVLIVGFARSGAAAASLLVAEGANVIVSDPKLDWQDERVINLKDKGVSFTDQQTEDLLVGVDLIVKNPGIPYQIPILRAALTEQIPIYTEVALAQRYIQGEWIALTGSNGKTTSVEMINAVLSQAATDQHRVLVAGNIGTPVSEIAKQVRPSDTLITELSSFQLMGMPTARPHIAIITNIFASHLDYHGTRENYIHAKMGITRNQTSEDYLVLNVDRPEWVELEKQTVAQIVPFSRLGLDQRGAYQMNGELYFRGEYIMDANQLLVPGEHNIENALVAIAVGRLEGISAEQIKQALQAFTGVEHRLQLVGNFAGRIVYNDSKATDIEATEMALSGFDQPVVLLAGGLDRGDDQGRLLAAIKKHVKALIVFGQTGPKLATVGKAAGIQVIEVDNVEAAVKPAFELAQPDEVILLSPAAASWDQYPNFETRGALFMEAVRDRQALN